MAGFTESDIEEAALAWLADLGWGIVTLSALISIW